MNKLQRSTIVNLSLAGVGLLLQLLKVVMWDLNIVRVAISMISVVVCCSLVISYFARRRLAKQGGSHYDERDTFICKRALSAGLMTLFFVIFASSVIAFISVGPGGAINIGILLSILILGAMSLFLAESLAILVQYGLGGNANE